MFFYFSPTELKYIFVNAAWGGYPYLPLPEYSVEVIVQGTGFVLQDGVPVEGTMTTGTYKTRLNIDGDETQVTLFNGDLIDLPDNDLAEFAQTWDGNEYFTTRWVGTAVYNSYVSGLADAAAGVDADAYGLVGVGATTVTATTNVDVFMIAGGVTVTAKGGDDIIYVATDDDGGEVLGGAGSDSLFGGGGNDMLVGHEGSDAINGGYGDDQIWGGSYDDVLSGDAGNDFIRGGSGNDTLDGGTGNDLLVGGIGGDTMTGGDDNDQLFGGVDDDVLFGGTGSDLLAGHDGDDVLFGGTGANVLRGGEGRDVIVSNGGSDLLISGAGADKFVFSIKADPPFPNHHDLTDWAVVTDFDLSEDVMQFGPHNNGAYTAAEGMSLFMAHATQVGTRVIFNDGTALIVLRDTDLSDLTIDHFAGSPDSGYYDWGS